MDSGCEEGLFTRIRGIIVAKHLVGLHLRGPRRNV
jgi:hypothetical protein